MKARREERGSLDAFSSPEVLSRREAILDEHPVEVEKSIRRSMSRAGAVSWVSESDWLHQALRQGTLKGRRL